MVNIVREFEVACPQERAIPYLADFANAVEWDPGTVSCTRIGKADAPVAPGSTWLNVSTFLGRETELVYQLMSQTQDTVVLEGSNKTADSRDDLRVDALSADTSRVRYEATITFKGLARFADPLMGLVFRKIADDTVKDMTTALEKLGK